LKDILEKLYILKSADDDAGPENYELGISEIIGNEEGNLRKIIGDLKKELNYTWDDDKVNINVKVSIKIEISNISLVDLGTNIGKKQTELSSIQNLFSDNLDKQIIHNALFTDIQTIMNKIHEHQAELTQMLDAVELKRQAINAPALSPTTPTFGPSLVSAPSPPP
jgi:hypothetical protein